MIKDAFASEHDVDAMFISQLDHAIPIVKTAKLKDRALNCVLSSLGNAKRPRPIDVMRRLIEQGFLLQRHLDAWSELRHSAAHGEILDNDNLKLQAHIDRFHICLDLFYRLVFIMIGYRGSHRDYSYPCDDEQQNWPDAAFPKLISVCDMP